MAPSSDIRRKIDACDAITYDIVRIILERLSGVDEEFDAVRERTRLRGLLKHDYAQSIYGSTAASNRSQRSSASQITAQRAAAAAELAAKEAEYETVLEELRQQEKIKALEEEHKKQMAAQTSELERLKAQKDVKAARARFEAYDRELSQVNDVQSIKSEQVKPYFIPKQPTLALSFTPAQTTPPNVSQLAQAIQDSIKLNRLPMPEPTVFSGESLSFIEWKSTFISLIEQQGISTADKLYYLKRYVTGPARKCLEGTFFRNDEEAYKDAWDKLNQRYGQPFVIQKAFRERLANWPKVQPRDADGLRAFEDFINVKGLQILNDSEENQKLLHKLPDWINARWNRQVTKTLLEGGEFPSFSAFASFLSLEAEVACNPVTSIHALRYTKTNSDKRYTKEIKGNKASVFNINATVESDKRMITKIPNGSPCTMCQGTHQLHQCPDLLKISEQSVSTSMIVPVWLSTTTKPLKEKLVYALLDTHSDTVFINQNVTHELQADVCPVKLKLTTMMGKNAVVSSGKVSDLLVRGYNSATVIKLPTAYTKDYIPANREHIPTCETAKQWSHLLKIVDEIPPLLSCEVSLLIGYTCSRALAPKQVILGKENEPYAIHTDLGWSIIGNSTPDGETDMASSLCHRVTVKEIPPSTPADAIRALERDFKEINGNERTVSQDDLIFLQNLEHGITRTENGHFEMPLTFKEKTQMPDNRQLAETRLNRLKDKSNILTTVTERQNAETVIIKDLQRHAYQNEMEDTKQRQTAFKERQNVQLGCLFGQGQCAQGGRKGPALIAAQLF
nr:uncharacterized protein LOC129445442 [Misgurnus anguillicaudatus]